MKNGKNKGISLIVLVITIIVMIILASAIIISLSNNGIIGKANEAVDETNLKQVQQAATLLWADAYSNGKTTQTDLETAVMEGLDDIDGLDLSKYTVTVTTGGVTVTEKVTDGDDTATVPEEWAENVTAIVDGVPIPKGFVASPYGADETNNIKAENTKNGGLVIYQLTDDEITNGVTTLPSTETQYTSWTTRNQYVWVPVDKDNFVTEFVRDRLGVDYDTLYGQTGMNDNLISSKLGSQDEKYFWEVELDENNMPLTTLSTESAAFMSADTLAEVQAMYASVKEYGGFYIARYEAGVSTERTTTSELVEGRANVYSMMGKIPYDWIPWSNSNTMNVDEGGAVQVARSLYTSDTTDANYSKYGVVSTLTYSVQWDRALQWMKEQNSQLDLTNSTSYGNHLDTTIVAGDLNPGAQFGVGSVNGVDYEPVTYDDNGNSTLTKTAELMYALTTGALKKANVNNIYDMSGNMLEQTMEGAGTERRNLRGGACGWSGAEYSMAVRFVSNGGSASYDGGCSFRSSLYIKK